jgi:hypothetical protein
MRPTVVMLEARPATDGESLAKLLSHADKYASRPKLGDLLSG